MESFQGVTSRQTQRGNSPDTCRSYSVLAVHSKIHYRVSLHYVRNLADGFITQFPLIGKLSLLYS